MKKLLIIFLFLAGAMRADTIRDLFSITNVPVNGDTIAFGTDSRYWTNGSITSPATQIFIGSTKILSASNLFYQIQLSRGQFPPPQWTEGSTNITFFGPIPLSFSTSAGWSTNVYTTNSAVPQLVVTVNATNPVGINAAANSNRILMASGIVAGINLSASNTFGTNITALTNYVDRYNAQNISNKSVYYETNYSPVLTNANLTNATAISGTAYQLTNGIYTKPIITNAIIQNSTNFIQNNNWELYDDAGNALLRISTNGWFTNYDANAGHKIQSYDGTTYNLFDGSGTVRVSEGGSLIQFYDSGANNVLNIGGDGLNLAGNLFMNGGNVTNLNTTGTNKIAGILIYTRTNNASLANGVNAGVFTGTNFNIKVTGPSSAFTIAGLTGGADDREIRIENSTGQQLTINNDSGLDAAAANRIYTPSGADVVLTNNPCFVEMKYDSSVTHWKVTSINGSVAIGGSGTFSGTFSGNGNGLTNVPATALAGFTMFNTNFALATMYSNAYGAPLMICALNVSFGEAAVAGKSSLTLTLTNSGVVTNINVASVTAIAGVAGSDTNAFPTFVVTNGGTWSFTDSSSGIGNSATPVGGQVLVY